MSAKQGRNYHYALLVVAFFTVLEVSNSSPCKCGRPNIPRIVGGGEVDPSNYPWLVVLQVYHESNWIYHCVGALIHPQWVLTAAHCVYKKSAKEIQIALGSTQGKDRKLEVAEVILYKNIRPNSTEHDIALLKLQSPVKCDKRVSPICLSKGREMESPGTPVIVAGWGQTGPDEAVSDVLKQASMIVSQCPNSDENSKALCAIGASSNDTRGTTCQGDSGAPLMHIDQNVYYTIGITSRGPKGCNMNEPKKFVRVSKFRKWINQYVNLQEVSK